MLDFGANGDGVTDNVKSFQNSLDAASAGGIGIALGFLFHYGMITPLQCLYHLGSMLLRQILLLLFPEE